MIKDDYELIDSGDGRKLERFGRYILARPCSQAMWRPSLSPDFWRRADASFDREDGNRWHGRSALPKEWEISTAGVKFRLGGTDFGHLGIFPEQRAQWKWIRSAISEAAEKRGKAPSVLNLFAYSGGSTMAAALGGGDVCHLDASRGMVEWARSNAKLNGLAESPIRWIVDDAHKFMKREIRRERRYDAIILDPPSFGRFEKNVFSLEDDLNDLLSLCCRVAAPGALMLFSINHRKIRLSKLRSAFKEATRNLEYAPKDVSIFVNDETVSVLGVGTDLKTIRCRFSRATND